MNRAFFDLSGTILHHNTKRPLPLMPGLLKSLSYNGWSVDIVTDRSEACARLLLERAGLDHPYPIHSSSFSSKGRIVKGLIDSHSDDTGVSVFIDDRPRHLESVRKHCGDRVRVIGFVGSRLTSPELSRWCHKGKYDMALSPVDLFEGLGVCGGGDLSKFSEGEIACLIPGLEHPMSSITGETANFDHRSILYELLWQRNLTDYSPIWRNIGWITCSECLWKVLVETVLGARAIYRSVALGNAYKFDEYTFALKTFVAVNPEIPILETFERACSLIKQGINEIGPEAADCRMTGKSSAADRLQFISDQLDVVFSGGTRQSRLSSSSDGSDQ
ncbi:MAG: hypothetical protein HQM09_17645 [Candidatus Riflebacteria bacterium]|nr:hypothetical protein [Candidatus Riflebacteria bacterium]